MNEITVFNNDEFGSIRTVTIENEPLTEKTQSCFGIELGQRGGWLINE